MIIQRDTNNNIINQFADIRTAASKTGIRSNDIRRVLEGDRNTAGGYIWEASGKSVKSKEVDSELMDKIQELIAAYTGKKESKQYILPTEYQYDEDARDNMYDAEGIHVILPCVHVPFHNKKLMEGFLDLLEDIKDNVAGFHIIGDFLDLNSLSAHDKGKLPMEGITLDYEYAVGNTVLDLIDTILPSNVVKTYIWGNHEDRYKRYMKDVDNSKLGEALPSPTTALKLKERGYDVYENWKEDFVTIGKHLDLIHGEFCTTYAAKKHIDVYRRSIMFAHTHRIQSFLQGQTGGYNIGTMADLDSPAFGYASRAMKNDWNNGFALVTIDEDGYFFPEQITFYNNRFFYNGKKY